MARPTSLLAASPVLAPITVDGGVASWPHVRASPVNVLLDRDPGLDCITSSDADSESICFASSDLRRCRWTWGG